ncbi:MAG: cupin domain-containing protein [Acidobacteria bacterium]|nr:cupin domain-containing protein [Acidobacteriota bacterium]
MPDSSPQRLEDIGKRLKQLREKRNFTLAYVSKLAGVSKSALCMIENENRTPGIYTLTRLSQVYRVLLNDLLGQQEEPEQRHIFTKKDRMPFPSDDGNACIEILCSTEPDSLMEFGLMRIKPKSGLLSEQGTRLPVGEMLGYVIKGTLTLIVEGKEYKAKEGECFRCRNGVPHNFRNQGHVTVEVVYASTPPSV